MRKKFLGIPIIAVILIIAIAAIPALAAYSGWTQTERTVKDPISPSGLLGETTGEIFPGQPFSVEGGYKNVTTDVTYGMQYYCGVGSYWNNAMSTGSAEKVDMNTFVDNQGVITSTTQLPKEQSQLQTQSMANAIDMSVGFVQTIIGKVTMFLDPDGPEGPLPKTKYEPGTYIELSPEGKHTVEAYIVSDAGLEAGITIVCQIYYQRGGIKG